MAKPTPEELAAVAAEAAAAAATKAAEDAELAALVAAEEAAAEAPADEAPKALVADDDGNIEVATTGDFMLLDPISGAEIEADGTSTVTLTSFVQQRYELGQLKPA